MGWMKRILAKVQYHDEYNPRDTPGMIRLAYRIKKAEEKKEKR